MHFELAPAVDLNILKTLTAEEQGVGSSKIDSSNNKTSSSVTVGQQQQRFGANIPTAVSKAGGVTAVGQQHQGTTISSTTSGPTNGMSTALAIVTEAVNSGTTALLPGSSVRGHHRELKMVGGQQVTHSHINSSTFDALVKEQRAEQQKTRQGGALFDERDRRPQVFRPQQVDVEVEGFLGGSVGQKRSTATAGGEPGDDERDSKRARTTTGTTTGRISPPIEPFCEMEQKHLYDYQGRSFLHSTLPPRKKNLENSIPSKVIQVWKPEGSLKKPDDDILDDGSNSEEVEAKKKASIGISALAWCSPHGHLLFAANLGGVVSIFDVSSHKECIAKFQCHGKAITSLAVSEGGKKFTTASYDGSIRVWNTETGECLDTILCPEGTTCRSLRYHPIEEHYLLSGVGKKIILWDLRTKAGKVAREYNRHLGNVLSLTFMDSKGARFISSAEDKTIRTWDFNVPVQIQGFADATMHAVPYIAPHPKERTFILQSLDNEAYLMQLNANGNSLKVNKDRKFTGHMVGGSSCTIEASPDGRYVSSGDVKGNLFFWEYATGKKVKSFRAHGSQLVQHLWHPTLPGLVATGSWDGAVKLWSS